ncbi:MAG TPA: MMPL family transporter [Streptosporangiaceae bacterium]|nr:MMPL family transporter [Streptosporangiaceae bacterium]
MRQSSSSVLPETDPARHASPWPASQGGDHRSRARAPVVERIAGWSARHRKTVVLGWLVLVALVFAVGHAVGTGKLQSYDSGQSGQAERTLDRIGASAPAHESVLIQARTPGDSYANDPAMRHAAGQVTAALARLPHAAAGIRSPAGPGDRALVSADGRSALVTFSVPGSADNASNAIGPALKAVASVQARHPGLRIAEAGDASLNQAVNDQVNQDFRTAETTSVPITLILLLLVFGALVAAGIPVLLAVTAVMTAVSLLTIPGHWFPIGSNTSEVVLLVGMAVGVDYSLFYLRREREERAKGASTAEAIRTAARTSGRAIVVSGLTVMAALAGLFLTGAALFDGMAIGAIMVVGVAVIGSLTVLPALLSWLGHRADWGRIPVLGRRRTAAGRSWMWGGLVRQVVRRPLLWGGAALLAMIALAAPAAGMRLANPGIDAPASLPVVHTIHQIETAFPAAPAPAQVVVTGRDLQGPAVTRAIDALRQRAARGGPIRQPVTVTSVAGGRALVIDVELAGDGGNATSDRALLALRDHILPATLGQAGVSYAVAGDTASGYDNTRQMDVRTPIVLAAVAGLAFLLLLITFRSLLLPLVSVGLNLLSVGAAYGLITLVFQDGRWQGPLGYTGFGAITYWVPLFLFVFLFGLSMDYHVFILSRIKELRARGHSTRQAIIDGIASSAGVVTSAAVIMMAVFSIFASMHEIELKMLGIGLPAAVLIDATIVRGILVPAAMALLGERCWYLPRWLGGRPPAALERPAPSAAQPS